MRDMIARAALGAHLFFLFAWAPAHAGKPLAFAWNVPSAVVVEETAVKHGERSRMRYRVELAPEPAGPDLHMRITRFEFVEVEGVDLADPGHKAELTQATALAAAIPVTVIGRDGRVTGVVGLEETITAALTVVPPEQKERISGLMRSPAMTPTLKGKSTEMWRLWVGMWAGFDVAPERPLITAMKIPMPGGATLIQPCTLSHRGPDPQRPAHALLEFEGRLEGETARQAFAKSIVATVGKATPPGRPVPTESDILGFERVTRVRVSTEPTSLRPAHVVSEVITTLKIKGVQDETRTERREFTFTWE